MQHSRYAHRTITTVPPIYVGSRVEPKLTVLTRVLFALLSIACIAVLITAARLSPDPSGVETHRQLGLPPCGMLTKYGVPCPSCGMTTSFTYLAHGQVAKSFITQPAGTVLALLAAIFAWAGGYIAMTGRPSARLLSRIRWTVPFFVILGIVIVAWLYKIVILWSASRPR